MRRALPLYEGWTLRRVSPCDDAPDTVPLDRPIPATVPGCVHTDLLAAGLIPDPYIAFHEQDVQWIGRCDWRYECGFDVDDDVLSRERVELCFDGLDTLATLTLNGHPLGEVQNMHRRYRFEVRDRLQKQGNTLTITFRAPLPAADEAEAFYGYLPHNGHGSNAIQPPHNMLRKNACSFGWDWGPCLPTCGVWRDVRLEAWHVARLGDVRPIIDRADDEAAAVRVVSPVLGGEVGTAGVKLRARLLDPEGNPAAEGEGECNTAGEHTLSLEVTHPRRWWPVGHGDQPLYRLEVELIDAAGHTLDRSTRRLGLRTLALRTEPDPQPIDGLGQGSGMTLAVNGRPVFLKGGNWIPDDCFLPRVTEADYRRRLTQAREANMNAIRVWGGGVFEDDAFYDLCDELGLLVWQDFLFACAGYPEEEPYRSEVEAEVRDNLARLAAHPSIALYNGCNENIWGTWDWGPDWVALRESGERTWGLGYYLDLLPRLVAELSPDRPYWAASPWSGSMDIHPNANEHGNRHIWNVWHGPGQYRNYLEHYPRMASEFGFHGQMTFATLDRAIPADHRRWDSPAMEHHNRNGGKGGQTHTHLRLRDDFDPPEDDFDAWLFLSQVMQARALEMGVSWFRSLHPWCGGAIYWQLNDCWPVSSWSAIDGDGRAKPLLHVSRRFFAPRLATIKPAHPVRDGEPDPPLVAALHNDAGEAWHTPVTLRRVTPAGEVIDTDTREVHVEPWEIARFPVPDTWADDPNTAIVIDADASRGWWWPAPDKRLAYPEPGFDAKLDKRSGGYRLSITAKTLLRDLCVFVDRLDPDAEVSDQCVSLLPGEAAAFDIITERELDEAALTAPPVLRCVNPFGQRG